MLAATSKHIWPRLFLAACVGGGLSWYVCAHSIGEVPAKISPGPVPPTSVGMNLGALNYWSQEFPFADIIDNAEIKVAADGGWKDPDGLISMNSAGYPVNVPAGTKLIVIIKSGGGDILPVGRYKCTISPGWDVRPSRVAKMRPTAGGFDLEVLPPPARGGLSLTLTPRGQQADLTELSCRSPAAGPRDIFNPAFLADNRYFSVIRFMDWMKPNLKQRMEWSKRTTSASFSQTSKEGASVEYMVALANQLKVDPWFTLPLEADDDYYRQFAIYVRDNLRPDQKAYVEVSNELWNTMFTQSKMAIAEGKRLYPTVKWDWEASSLYYADRIRAVMAIWQDVFKGQRGRIVRVYATQAGSRRNPTAALSHKDTVKFVDAMAIAPYFGPQRGMPPAGVDATEYVLTHGDEFIDHTIRKALVSKEMAKSFGLPLITYEGGPDYVSSNRRLRDDFAKAEHDPRMYDIYMKFLRRWHDEVGGLYVAFDSINQRYGHMLYTGQPLNEAPKMRALVDFIQEHRIGKASAG